MHVKLICHVIRLAVTGSFHTPSQVNTNIHIHFLHAWFHAFLPTHAHYLALCSMTPKPPPIPHQPHLPQTLYKPLPCFMQPKLALIPSKKTTYIKFLNLRSSQMKMLAVFFVLLGFVGTTFGGNFNQDFDITWGEGRAKILDNGKLLTLSLDKNSGSGFRSKNQYLFGKIDMQLKLVPGNSAGTVTAYYLSSLGSNHDEIDFEFLGNLSGDPYILHTNVFTQGKGNREQRFYLWFDPTKDFHTYSILWNPQSIILSVDGTPIRQFKNQESKGLPYPKKQPMWIFSSLWNADDWATRGGLVKTDWTQAPFTASYTNFNVLACIGASSSCSKNSSANSWFSQSLDNTGQERIKWVQKNYMIYNYCTDSKRFPQGFPPECSVA